MSAGNSFPETPRPLLSMASYALHDRQIPHQGALKRESLSLQGNQTRSKSGERTHDAQNGSLIEVLGEMFHEIMVSLCIIADDKSACTQFAMSKGYSLWLDDE